MTSGHHHSHQDHAHHDHGGHGHGKPGHGDHAHAHDDNERRSLIAFAVTTLFMLVEAAGGWLSGSLALVADAAHMLTDAAALLLAWLAFRFGRLQPDARRSYGYRRLEVLAALVNGLAVVGLSLWIFYEAAQRLADPQPVQGWPMMAVAVAGLVANLAVLRVLHAGHDHAGHDHANLNLRGASLHVLGDLLGSVAAVGAAAIILFNGWTPIDPILSMAVAAMILFNAWGLIKAAAHILLEGAPEGFDGEDLRAELLGTVPGLADVHHIHAWSLTTGRPLITLHATLAPGAGHDAVLAAIKLHLRSHCGIGHSVVQVEAAHCPDETVHHA